MHVRTRRLALATLAASSLLLLSACNGGSNSADKADKKGKAAPSAPAVPDSITAEQAQQALVGLGDLPAGWKLEANTGLDKSQGAEEDMMTGAKALCAPVTAVLNSGRLGTDYKANAQEVFTKKGDQTTVAQDVSGYPRAQAERAMAGLRAAIEQCGTFTAQQGGHKATVTVKKTAEQPKYADESIRYTVKIVQGDMQMDFDMGTVRSHGAITTVLNNYPDHGDRGLEAFTKALSKAAGKLVAAAAKTA
ncbi:hypothetical protein [Streptomyces sp. CBMA152]|uniref:hypothetical protein n=1 Tax=Streptomyces sp. CBMA152 TaxID=1896312 RepID=UPI0016615727|nr:hypothetical protein [Streptomyces sp. CBMA152]MBD0742397.1 hypothetical protein [Streptomyces sp. CBMA152]